MGAVPSGYCSVQLAGAAAALSNEQPERSAKAMGNSSRNIIEISFPEFEFVRTIVEDCSPSFQSGVAFLGSSWKIGAKGRSEEHTSELQSLMRISYAVFCLKKKIKQT